MSALRQSADVLIVGAGPAGMAAAISAAEQGARVVVLDDNPFAGGQIWRRGREHANAPQAARWLRKFESLEMKTLFGTQVIAADASARTLLVEQAERAFRIEYRKLIVATGARELFLPFPGWTLPNVMGVGGLQALVKSGLPVESKRILVAGSGPLLLAAAAYFREHGARVPLIAEQAPLRSIARFALQLLLAPGRLFQALRLRLAPREELRHLATGDTIDCRCEDVSLNTLGAVCSWRAAKLHARCGMGGCQGRICGPAVQFLFEWHAESVRPPLFPARISSLI